MQKAFIPQQFKNYPAEDTPLNETNLNRIVNGLDEVDNRVITLDTTKATKVEVSELFYGVSFNEATGVITCTRKNGAQITIDTKLEKLAVNFAYDPVTERLVITLDDGTKQYVDLSALITVYEFLDSDTIAFAIEGGRVKAIVKEGSIQGKHLQPDYLADITVQAEIAMASKQAAAQSEENARVSEEQSGINADSARKSADTATKAKEGAVQASNDALNMVSDVTEKLETGYFNGPPGIQGPPGEKGEKGEKGDTGESGITVPVNGFFTLAVEADGNLWAYSAENGTTPEFEYDAETGNLYIVTEVA